MPFDHIGQAFVEDLSSNLLILVDGHNREFRRFRSRIGSTTAIKCTAKLTIPYLNCPGGVENIRSLCCCSHRIIRSPTSAFNEWIMFQGSYPRFHSSISALIITLRITEPEVFPDSKTKNGPLRPNRVKSAGGRVARGCAAHTIPHRPIGVAMGGWNNLAFGIRTPGHPDIHASGSVTDGANLEGKCAVLHQRCLAYLIKSQMTKGIGRGIFEQGKVRQLWKASYQ